LNAAVWKLDSTRCREVAGVARFTNCDVLFFEKRLQTRSRQLNIANAERVCSIEQHGSVLNSYADLIASFGVLDKQGSWAKLQ
jgi:hypothetical protein